MKKPDLSKIPAAKIFPKEMDNIKKGLCACCGIEIQKDEFRDDLSKREYATSGMCQDCQDSVFGKGG